MFQNSLGSYLVKNEIKAIAKPLLPLKASVFLSFFLYIFFILFSLKES